MALADHRGRRKKLTRALQFYLDNAGKDFKWLAKLRAETGANVPTLDKLPLVPAAYRWLWEAYNLLSGRRIETERGPQPIQLTEIQALCAFYGLDPGMTRDLLDVTLALDMTYLEHVRKKRPQGEGEAPRSRRGRSAPRGKPGKPPPQRIPLVPAKRR